MSQRYELLKGQAETRGTRGRHDLEADTGNEMEAVEERGVVRCSKHLNREGVWEPAPGERWKRGEEGTDGRPASRGRGKREEKDADVCQVSRSPPAKRMVPGERSHSVGIKVGSPSFQGSASRDKSTGSKIQIEEMMRTLAIQISQRKEGENKQTNKQNICMCMLEEDRRKGSERSAKLGPHQREAGASVHG